MNSDEWSFPEHHRTLAVLAQCRDDFLSWGGVVATAITLALATQIDPAPTRGHWYLRSIDAAVVVLVAIASLAALVLLARIVSYEWTANRRYEITVRYGSLVVRSRNRERWPLPRTTEVRVRGPNAYWPPEITEPEIVESANLWMDEEWVVEVKTRRPEIGERYEVRVYARPGQLEVIRRCLVVTLDGAHDA